MFPIVLINENDDSNFMSDFRFKIGFELGEWCSFLLKKIM